MTRQRFMELSNEAGLDDASATDLWNARPEHVNREDYPEVAVVVSIAIFAMGQQILRREALKTASRN